MELITPDVDELLSEVWQAMLDREPPTRAELLPHPAGEKWLTACVLVSGAYEGAVLLGCPEDLGRSFAAALFHLPATEIDDELLWDAMGELTNVLGGNVKALLPGPSRLSLPTVSEGRDHRVVVPGMVPELRLGLQDQDRPLELFLLKAPSGAAEDSRGRGREP